MRLVGKGNYQVQVLGISRPTQFLRHVRDTLVLLEAEG